MVQARKKAGGIKVAWQPVVYKPLLAMDPLPVEVDLITALQSINDQICSFTDIDELLEGICAEMGRILKTDRVHLALKVPQKGTFGKVVHEWRSGDSIPATLGADFPSEEDDEVMMDLVSVPPPLAVIDPLGNPKLAEGPRAVFNFMQVKSAMAGRLQYQGKVLGVLCVHQCDVVRQWTSAEATFLSVVLSQLSIAIANARMIKSLSAQHKELVSLHFKLEESHSALERQVAERTEQLRMANGELLGMIEELHELDRLKGAFLDTISHELRTPINFITGFGSLLADGAYGDLTPTAHVACDKILEGAERLIHLVDDLLDQSKMERGHLRIQPRSFDYAELIAHIGQEFRPLFGAKGQQFSIEAPSPMPEPVADPERVHQVLRNLLSNAIKFTPEGGQVQLTIEQQGPLLITRISDNGIGIPPEAHVAIFDRFYQVDNTRTRNYGGTGLGLAIVKGLVEAMDGEIAVESVVGHGTTFSFTLPVWEAAASTEEATAHGKTSSH